MKALLIGGNEKRFKDDVLEFEKFLFDDVGLDEGDVKKFFTAYSSKRALLSAIVEFLAGNRNEPHVLLFRGHGDRPHWIVNKDEGVVEYQLIATLIKTHVTPLFWINSCCFSGSALRYMDNSLFKRSVPFGFIASTGVHEKEFGNRFLREFTDMLKTRAYMQPGVRYDTVREEVASLEECDPELIAEEDRERFNAAVKLQKAHPSPVPAVLIKHTFLCNVTRQGIRLDHWLFPKLV